MKCYTYSTFILLLICGQLTQAMSEAMKQELALSRQSAQQSTQASEKGAQPSLVIKVSYGVAEDIGGRREMEDAHREEITKDGAFFGVFDGHGGSLVAHFAAEKLYDNCKLAGLSDANAIQAALKNGFLTTHDQLDGDSLYAVERTIKGRFEETKKTRPLTKVEADQLLSFIPSKHSAYQQGSTAVVAFIRGDQLFVANAGDSRAVLCRDGKAIALSKDHKAGDAAELKRVLDLGGAVLRDRVQGVLAVSRALGDKALNPYVTPEPEITQTTLEPNDTFLILACDGVWDVFSSQEAVNIVQGALKAKPDDFENTAKALMNAAVKHYNQQDNVTVIVVGLKQQ